MQPATITSGHPAIRIDKTQTGQGIALQTGKPEKEGPTQLKQALELTKSAGKLSDQVRQQLAEQTKKTEAARQEWEKVFGEATQPREVQSTPERETALETPPAVPAGNGSLESFLQHLEVKTEIPPKLQEAFDILDEAAEQARQEWEATLAGVEVEPALEAPPTMPNGSLKSFLEHLEVKTEIPPELQEAFNILDEAAEQARQEWEATLARAEAGPQMDTAVPTEIQIPTVVPPPVAPSPVKKEFRGLVEPNSYHTWN